MVSVNTASLKAIVYADLFDFPLTKDESLLYAVGKKTKTNSQSFSSVVEEQDGYLFLKGREELVALRKRRKIPSDQKRELGHIIGKYVSYIPTVLFVGISGGVGASNADLEDDIDFFIITMRRTLWPTRLLVLILLHLIGRRRAKNDRFVRDRICLNMLVDETKLSAPQRMRSLYTAYEIVNLIPVISKGNMYNLFLQANEWVFSYLPNAKKKCAAYVYITKNVQHSWMTKLLSSPLMVQLASILQKIYMGRGRNSMQPGVALFFPDTFQSMILERYAKRTEELGLKSDE